MASGILFSRRIKGEMTMQGLKPEMVAKKIGRGKSWIYNALSEPSKMSLGDFVALCKALHLEPDEVLRENILYKGMKGA